MFSCTGILGVDNEHAEEFSIVWPTWKANAPELLEMQWLVVFDHADNLDRMPSDFFDTVKSRTVPAKRVLDWSWEPGTHREKMLNAISYACLDVDTRYFLKIDTDVVALKSDCRIDQEWFRDLPSIIASPWGYTKPACMIDMLDMWANQNYLFRDTRSLPPHAEKKNKAYHARIISYVYFGLTDWHRIMLQAAGTHLPVPSHDTFFWYCAERHGSPVRRVKMSRHGWRHIGSNKTTKLRALSEGSI